MKHPSRHTHRRGFTIVELVIVIAVIAILATVLVPTFGDIIDKAKDSAAKQEAKNAYTEYMVDAAASGNVASYCVYEAGANRFVAIANGSVVGVYDTQAEALAAMVSNPTESLVPTGNDKLFAYGGTPVVPDQPKDDDSYAGKTVSILGDSISTFSGVSTGPNHYSNGTLGVYQVDTWWQQVIDALDMNLLVNNSIAGSCVFQPYNNLTPAYPNRCVALDKNGTDPDVIVVFMGTNDFTNRGGWTIGTDNINYSALIQENGDGTFTYAEPTTVCEAYALMLQKMIRRYPNAEIFCMTLPLRRDPVSSGSNQTNCGQPVDFNNDLETIIHKFGCTVVDLENCFGAGTDTATYDTYVADKWVHPGSLGMDKISEALLSTMLGKDATLGKVSGSYIGVETDHSGHSVLLGHTYNANLSLLPGYENMSVTVTMAGQDVTASVYADDKITIDNVTGDITISATATSTQTATFHTVSGWQKRDNNRAIVFNVELAVGDIVNFSNDSFWNTYKYAIGNGNVADKWVGGGYQSGAYTVSQNGKRVLFVARQDNANITADDLDTIAKNLGYWR